MAEQRDFETRLAEAVRRYATAADRAFDPSAMARNAPESSQRRGFLGRLLPAVSIGQTWRNPAMGNALKFALAGAAALVVVAIGIGLYFSQPGTLVGPPVTTPSPEPTHTPVPTPRWGATPGEQMTVISQMVDAINARDTDTFIGVFASDGAFNPRGDFKASSSLFGNTQPVGQAHLVHAWMAINDAWDFEAELLECNELTEADYRDGHSRYADVSDVFVECEVASRWHGLSLEITEAWSYEFHGAELLGWNYVIRDLNPPGRTLPLGYDGLEEWEAWLEANHPEDATRLLNPRRLPDCEVSVPTFLDEDRVYENPEAVRRDCEEWLASLADDPAEAARLARLLWWAESDWSIDDRAFWPNGLVPYDPSVADEIEASLKQYLDGR